MSVVVVLFVLAGTVRWWGRLFFPFPYRDAILNQSSRHGLDPLLVLAIIREESYFKPEAVSRRGALGLMQVMPETGAWIAAQLDEGYSPRRLLEPADNIRFGTWYLGTLLLRFRGDKVRALAAYNAGYNRIETWLAEGVWDGSLAELRQLPFQETRRYVIKIMRSYEIYRFLYD